MAVFSQIILWKPITASQGEKHFRMKKNSDLLLLEDYEVVTENSTVDFQCYEESKTLICPHFTNKVLLS